VPTIFSTHTERRNNKKVLQNRTTTRNLSLRIGERRELKWIIKKNRKSVRGGGVGGVRCVHLTRNEVQCRDHGKR
jgi:hypothetical protein